MTTISSLSEALGLVKYCAVDSTKLGLNELTKPKNILEYIINFFTFGAVRKHYAQPYEELVSKMTTELTSSGNGCNLPESFSFEIFGYNVTFKQPNEDSHIDSVIVSVDRKGEYKQEYIDKNIFNKVCTSLVLRQMGGLPCTPDALTKDNCMNLKQANFSSKDLKGYNLSEADLRGVNFMDADLTGADLSNVTLGENRLEGAILNNIRLDGYKQKGLNLLDSPWNYMHFYYPASRDAYINQIKNKTQRSMLTTIDSIPEKYRKIKVTLAIEALEVIDRKEFNLSKGTQMQSLKEVLYKEPYLSDERIMKKLDRLLR